MSIIAGSLMRMDIVEYPSQRAVREHFSGEQLRVFMTWEALVTKKKKRGWTQTRVIFHLIGCVCVIFAVLLFVSTHCLVYCYGNRLHRKDDYTLRGSRDANYNNWRDHINPSCS